MDFNYELKKLRDMKKAILANGEDLKERQTKELEQAKKKIAEKYHILFSEFYFNLDNINSEIYNQCKMFEKYATFNVEDISNILASLMSIYESESFLVRDLSYQIKGALFNDTLLIINKKKYDYLTSQSEIQERHINSLVKNGFAVRLMKGFSKSQFPTEISFYEADSMGRINQNVNFKSFVYIKGFIKYVINYRIENNLDEISFEELEMLKNKFISYNLEPIEAYHQRLDEIKRMEFEESLEHDKQVRNRQLQRVLKKQK